jgi:hypothetical protein
MHSTGLAISVAAVVGRLIDLIRSPAILSAPEGCSQNRTEGVSPKQEIHFRQHLAKLVRAILRIASKSMFARFHSSSDGSVVCYERS